MNKSLLHGSIEKHTHFAFSRSSGKGGQNVNKVNTKVLACIALKDIEGLSHEELFQIRKRLENSINKKDEIFVNVQQERSQELNRKLALKILEAKILAAAKMQPKRKKTKVPKSVNEKRLQKKRLTSKIKQMRSKIW